MLHCKGLQNAATLSCSCDIDIDAMVLIHELDLNDLYLLKTYLQTIR